MSSVNPIAAQSIAHQVADLVINNPEPTSRSVLNRHFKTTSNIPANDRLSLAILNLLEYGYLFKSFDQTTSSVSYWPTPKLASLKGKVLECYPGTPEPVTRISGYPDFIGSAAVDLIPASTVETPVVPAPAPVTNGELVQEPVNADWCPIKEFLAAQHTNSNRADHRASAILVYIAMRQHWQKPKVIDELNKLMRPYLVTRAIDFLFDKGVVEVVTFHRRAGSFQLLRVVDQNFVAKAPQIEPPLMHDIRVLARADSAEEVVTRAPIAQEEPQAPVAQVDEEHLRVARLIGSMHEDDRSMVIRLITRLTSYKG